MTIIIPLYILLWIVYGQVYLKKSILSLNPRIMIFSDYMKIYAPVFSLNDDRVAAFSHIGLMRSSIFVTNGLTKVFDYKEFLAICHHEAHHLFRMDSLAKQVINIMALLYFSAAFDLGWGNWIWFSLVFVPVRIGYDWYAEFMCDRYAAKMTSPVVVVNALQKFPYRKWLSITHPPKQWRIKMINLKYKSLDI